MVSPLLFFAKSKFISGKTFFIIGEIGIYLVTSLCPFLDFPVTQGGIPVLVTEMNYSQVHLNRIAHEYEGKNIFAILTRYRMQYAATLLKTTDLTINKIAASVGYNSISHFSDAFKKETGFTPSKYKTNELLNHTKAGEFGPTEI